ncbi:hypothetical protein WL88_09440 [Burkholderia diffusa]|uniref:Cobalamin biosynthesis protein CbiG n=2 Tax=Burkholderia diffusa TaxID=488732 RepID=A0AAW3PJN8_9BURK|nr:hypothetical protein WL85_28340 [Burkholderia diffusa]KWF31486.1 hypothetical protein WL86_00850 [Burkholderia diffusa]KWF42823.1 hypothetical protein WL87_25400 [Burkholderia diffusa]KWF57084.1 hypothetical protein WL88_09440 [Burkholderia diffusa]
MKHVDDIRFVATGPALRDAGRVRAPRTHVGVAPVARMATALCDAARRSLSLRRVVQFAAAPVADAATIAAAFSTSSAGNPVMADATLACAIADHRGAPAAALRRIAHARAAPAMPSPARRRPLSSVRLTLMQDHSS